MEPIGRKPRLTPRSPRAEPRGPQRAGPQGTAFEARSLQGEVAVDFLPPGTSVEKVREELGPGALAPSVLVANDGAPSEQPKRWRSFPPDEGRSSWLVSGSGELWPSDITRLLGRARAAGRAVRVVDLRLEPHLYVDGLPATYFGGADWANAGLDRAQALLREELILQAVRGEEQVVLSTKKALKARAAGQPVDPTALRRLRPGEVRSEGAAVRAAGGRYTRLLWPDHMRPPDEEIDALVKVVRDAQRRGEWLHFHCRGGVGRTTTAMAMADMLVNAGRVPLEVILTRQKGLGGTDLFPPDESQRGTYKFALRQDRYAFLQSFYRYAEALNASPGRRPPGWLDWLAQNGVPAWRPFYEAVSDAGD